MITLPLCCKDSGVTTALSPRIAANCGREGKRAALIVGTAPALPKRIRIAASAEPARARRGRELSGCRRTQR